MDRAAVVAYRIDDGERLLNRLLQDGIQMEVAFWMYTNDDERWGLYIASESMNLLGIKNTYMKVVLALKDMPELRIDLMEVTLLEPSRPLAQAFLDYISLLPNGSEAWIERSVCNGVYVEIAYIYPVPTRIYPDLTGSAQIRTARHQVGR